MKKNIFKQLIIMLIITLTSIVISAQNNNPKVSKSIFFGISKPIRDATIILPGEHDKEQDVVWNFGKEKEKLSNRHLPSADKPVLQREHGNRQSIGPHLNIEGVGNVNNVRPADPNGEVGPDHYIQTVNCSFAVWDKDGNLIFGPVDNHTVWESLPGPWHNDPKWGDPVIKYDHLADRWIISCISAVYGNPPYYEMIAVSTTGDPLGTYYCYAFEYEYFNDYPKLSVWHDGYYLTYNMYDEPGVWFFVYSLVSVADRNAMLTGEPEVTRIQFEIPDPDIERFFPIPADLRGTVIPADSPAYIITVDDHNPTNPWELSLDVYEFQTDWQEPGNSTFEQVSQFDLGIFEPVINFGPGAPQLGSDINVQTIPIFMMYPVTFRMFDTHESMVCCHTMWDGDIHYIKWYELRKEDAEWYMHQSGNYAPGDLHYFMPSISMNGNGDIALGYTVSSEEIYPSMRLTGRHSEDTPGLMTFEEIELFKGLNYANLYHGIFDQNRWGDYASMMVDPSDDTTFWFTSMYTLQSTNLGNWATRIVSFDLSGVSAEPYADAGNDTLTCNPLFFTTRGSAKNYSSIVWTTSGDGNFVENYTPNATYLRGPNDLSNKQVTLTMHLTGYEPGTEAADSMILYINKEPEVYAGPDVTIDTSGSVTLHGEVNFAYEYFWTTLGDGSFTDSTMLETIYTPGPGDLKNEGVTLVLTANEVSPCTGSVSDSMNVIIVATGMDYLLISKIDLQIYPNPTIDITTLKAITPPNEQVSIEILNGTGTTIFTGRFYSDDIFFEKQFDLSYLESGIYFIRLCVGNETETMKLLLIN